MNSKLFRRSLQAMPPGLAAWLLCRRLPRHVFVEPTNRCNLRCPLCIQPNHPRQRGSMELGAFEQIANELRLFADGLVMHLLGESLLNESFFDMVRHAEGVGLRCTFTTNGQLLDQHIDDVFRSGLTSITICLDGADEETHVRYREGSDFHRVRAAIETLCRERRRRSSSRPSIFVQNLTLRFNVGQRKLLERWAAETGVDRIVDRPIHLGLGKVDGDFEELAREYLPKTISTRREEQDAVGLCPETRVCPELYRATILWNGDVVPCMRGCWNSEGSFGNVLEDGGFRKVWRSREHREFVRGHLRRGAAPCTVKKLFEGE